MIKWLFILLMATGVKAQEVIIVNRIDTVYTKAIRYNQKVFWFFNKTVEKKVSYFLLRWNARGLLLFEVDNFGVRYDKNITEYIAPECNCWLKCYYSE